MLATDDELLRMMLLRRTEEEDESTGLVSGEEYRRVRDRTGPDPDFFLYANLGAVWGLVRQMSRAEGSGNEAMRALEAMGFTGMRSLGMAMRFEEDGFSQRMFLHVPGSRDGLLRLLPSENSALLPPRFVPPGAVQAFTVKLDIERFSAGLRGMLDAMEEGTAAEMDSGLSELKTEAGIDIEKDLIGLLDGAVTAYTMPSRETEGPPVSGSIVEGNPEIGPPPEAAPPRAVYAFRLKDPEKFGRAFEALLDYGRQAGGLPVEREEYLGVRMHVLPFSEEMAMGIGVVGNDLVLATSKEDLQAVIRRKGKEEVPALVAGEPFARAMRSVPPIRSMVYYGDLGAQLEMMGKTFSLFPGSELPLDFSLFPTETFRAYFGVLGGALVSEEAGFLLVSRSYMKVPEDK
jgi:hypothetical protein